MKWIVPVIFTAITLPFMFNACGMFHSAGSDAYTEAAACRRMLENGHVIAVKTLDHSAVFASRKVVLSESDKTTPARVQSVASIPAGRSLSVILDNSCVAKENPRSALVAAVMSGASPHPALVKQAYSYVVPNTISQGDLENQADADACVLGISWNQVYHPQQTTLAYSVNDPMLPQQTHLTAMRAPMAWSLFYGSPYGMPVNGGTPVRIAVVDSGIDYNHPDLQGNIWSFSQGWGLDVTDNTTTPYDPMDIAADGHGTHIAGDIAAVSNNGTGIAGTMPFNAKIIAIKIYVSDGNGGVQTTTTAFYNGMQAALLNGADVINLSLATVTTDYDAVAEEGVNSALGQGVFTAVAIGNGNPNGQLVDGTTVHVMPAMLAAKHGVIGVASYDSNTGNISAFSNYSTTYAEIAAPGENSAGQGIFSTLPLANSAYGTLAGTSEATPFVSAAAALTIGWIRDSYGITPSPAEVERLILGSAAENTQLAGYVQAGHQLDLYNLAVAIQQAYPGTNGGPKTVPANANCK